MEKNNTLQELFKRASEQQVVTKIPLSGLFLLVSRTIGSNPWRILIPFSFLMVLFLHLGIGQRFDNAILWLFGGL